MGALRLHLYKQTLSPSVKESDAEEYSMYKEALSFDGGLSFADDESLVIQKKDGSIFESAITHYETDVFTVTYVGHFPNGKPFRFLFEIIRGL